MHDAKGIILCLLNNSLEQKLDFGKK